MNQHFGHALLEALIMTLILSIGVSALISLETLTLRSTYTLEQRSTAQDLAVTTGAQAQFELALGHPAAVVSDRLSTTNDEFSIRVEHHQSAMRGQPITVEIRWSSPGDRLTLERTFLHDEIWR